MRGRCFAVSFWTWCVLMGLSLGPPLAEWTSAKRVVMEIGANIALVPCIWLPSIMWQRSSYGSFVGWVWEQMDPDALLPQKGSPYYKTLARPPFKVVQSQFDLTPEDFQLANAGKLGIVVKNFTQGKLHQFSTIEGLSEHVNNDEFLFKVDPNVYREKHGAEAQKTDGFGALLEKKGLRDGLAEMRDTNGDLYLAFADSLLAKNPNVSKAIDEVFEQSSAIDDIQVATAKYLKQVFISYGTKSRTGLHVAPVRDWLVQVSGTKRWHFVLPQYTPYLRPYFGTFPAFTGAKWHLQEEDSVPFAKVFTEPGDLLFFPSHWWHEVHNVQEGLGFAVGLRPLEKGTMFLQLASSMVPFVNMGGLQSMRLSLFAGIAAQWFKPSSAVVPLDAPKDFSQHQKDRAAALKGEATSEYPAFTQMYLDQGAAVRKAIRERYVGCEARYRCEM